MKLMFHLRSVKNPCTKNFHAMMHRNETRYVAQWYGGRHCEYGAVNPLNLVWL